MKRRAVQVVVVFGIVVLAVVLRRRDELPKTPEDTVSAFFDAAGRGDDDAYLKLVSGNLLDTLRSARDQVGPDAFRANLRRSAAGIKGLAVTRRPDAGADFVTLEVEIVFADRNERQQMLLARQPGGWVIASIDTALATKPAKTYGTPVYDD
ncbi:MAG: hypothetical protein HY718_01060 [Planctomycetes bacterium]|nr:hypothetical protein [Planctomycetota bacterium]